MIIVEDNLVSQELQDYYHTLVFGSASVNALLPLNCKHEPTAFENGSMPISFEHVFKSSTKLTEHYGNFSKIPQVVCSKLNINLMEKACEVKERKFWIILKASINCGHSYKI